MTPEDLQSWQDWKELDAKVVPPAKATCGKRTIDFFVTSGILADRVKAVEIVGDIETAPHSPVRLALRSGNGPGIEWRLVVPTPFGPRPPSVQVSPMEDWEQTRNQVQVARGNN